MLNRLQFLRFRTKTIYFNNSNRVISFVRNIKKLKKFPMSTKLGSTSVNVTFFPSLVQMKGHNFNYSSLVDAFLTGPNGYSAFIQLALFARIEDSKDWDISKFQSFLSYSADNATTMAAPALRKVTHLLYTIFSSSLIDGEVYVPDMVNVFNAKVKRELKNR